MSKFNLLKTRPAFKDFPFHASVSKIKTFDPKSGGCHLKFYRGYIERLPKKEWDFHFFGKFCHRVLELFHKTTIDNPEKIKDSEFLSFAMAHQKDEGLKEFGEKLTEEQKLECFKIFDTYLAQFYELQQKENVSQILAVEDEFFIDLDGKVLLQGVIDRIDLDHDGIRKCADYKTAKDMNFLEKDDFQLLTYCFVDYLRHPEATKFRGSYIMLKHDCQEIKFEYSPEKVIPIGEKFLAYAEEIQKEKLFRPNPTPLCSYCDFNDQTLCPEGYSMTKMMEKKKKEKEQKINLKNNVQVFGATKW